jgi:hypothetical protein
MKGAFSAAGKLQCVGYFNSQPILSGRVRRATLAQILEKEVHKRVSQTWSFGDRVVAAPDVMLRAVGEESVLLNLKTGNYFGADEVATRMWTALTGSETIQKAFDSLLVEYDVDLEQLHHDLEEFLKKLMDYGLIDVKPSNVSSPEEVG